jgi:hypothetical protein
MPNTMSRSKIVPFICLYHRDVLVVVLTFTFPHESLDFCCPFLPVGRLSYIVA